MNASAATASALPDPVGQFHYTWHDTRVPPLSEGHDPRRAPVLVVGGGPVGLGVALALAREGLSVRVVDTDHTVCAGSRAICISRRSLEILEQLGVLEPFLARGLPWNSGRSFHRTREVLNFSMPHDEDQRLPPMLNIGQFDIEQFLLDGLAKYPDQVELVWGTRLTAMRQDGTGVRATLQADTGECYTVDADWLVACDGARSQVRDCLGLRMSGTSYEGRYVIVDIELDTRLPTGRLAWFDPPSNPGRTMLMHRQPDNIWRLDYQLHPDEDPDEAVRPENVLPVVRQHLEMIGETGAWKPLWISMYRANAVSLDEYRHGRVLFVGDSAHLVPIFGVRGLNSGFDDVWNLAWKLARVQRGESSAALLDSYSRERRQAWQVNMAHATRSTEFMAPPSRGFELMREAVLSLAGDHPALRALINPRQSSAITYDASMLSTPDVPGEDWSADGAMRPGAPLAECLFEDGAVALTAVAQGTFTLIVRVESPDTLSVWSELTAVSADGVSVLLIVGAGASVTMPVSDASDAAPRILHDAHDRFARLFDARDGSAWLLRPDGHLAARWRHPDPSSLRQALRRAQGEQA